MGVVPEVLNVLEVAAPHAWPGPNCVVVSSKARKEEVTVSFHENP